MRRLTGLALFLLLMSAIQGPLQARETDAIKRFGQLIICANQNALPVSSKGEPAGFQVEIAEELARRLEVRPVMEWIWASYQTRFTDCDLLLGVARDPRPGGHLHYLQALSDVRVVLVTRASETAPSLETLSGRRVAVQSASLAHFRLLELGAEPRVAYRSQIAILDAVAEGEIFAGVVSNLALAWYKKSKVAEELVAVDTGFLDIPDRYPMTIGLRNADSLTRADFEELIAAMVEDGTLIRILDAYGQTLSEQFDNPYAGLDEAIKPPRSSAVRRDLIEKVEELVRESEADGEKEKP